MYFLDESSVVHLFKEKAKTLSLVPTRLIKESMIELFTETCVRIFASCKNLVHLDLNGSNSNKYARLSLCNLPQTSCFSSSLVILYANLVDFDDCLCLLDGRLPYLAKLIVDIKNIDESSLDIDKMVNI